MAIPQVSIADGIADQLAVVMAATGALRSEIADDDGVVPFLSAIENAIMGADVALLKQRQAELDMLEWLARFLLMFDLAGYSSGVDL